MTKENNTPNQAEEVREALERLAHDVRDLIANSEGVYGLHRNGDLSPWFEIDQGGQFEPWLGEALAQADIALAIQPTGDA